MNVSGQENRETQDTVYGPALTLSLLLIRSTNILVVQEFIMLHKAALWILILWTYSCDFQHGWTFKSLHRYWAKSSSV